MSFLASSFKQPAPIEPDFSLDQLLSKEEESGLTIYFINVTVVGAKNLKVADFLSSDPYCEVMVGEMKNTTKYIDNTTDPVWNDKMHFFVAEKPESIKFGLFDKDAIGKDDELGEAEFPITDQFETQEDFTGELKVIDGGKQKGTLSVRLAFRAFKPIETEVKLKHSSEVLKCKNEELLATAAVLGQSEDERKVVLGKMQEKEEEVVRKTKELDDTHLKYKTEISEVIAERDQKIDAAEKQKVEMEALKVAAESEITVKEGIILSQTGEIEVMNNAASQMKEQIEEKNKEASLLKAQIDEKNEEISKIKEQMEEKNKEASLLKAQIDEKSKESSQMKAQIDVKSIELSQIKEQIDVKDHSIKTKDDELKNLQAQIDKLKKENQTLQVENGELREQSERLSVELSNKKTCFFF